MHINNMKAIDYVYRPHDDEREHIWAAFGTEKDAWDYLKEQTAFGLEREYSHTKKELRARNYGVNRYRLEIDNVLV